MSNPGYCPTCKESGWACRCGRAEPPTDAVGIADAGLIERQFERLRQVEDVLLNGARYADDPECHHLYPHAVAARQILQAEIERLRAASPEAGGIAEAVTDEMIEAGRLAARRYALSAPDLKATYLAMRAASPESGVERDEPDAFEAWWQNHPNHNREPANYTVKKQIAWDAWWARSTQGL